VAPCSLAIHSSSLWRKQVSLNRRCTSIKQKSVISHKATNCAVKGVTASKPTILIEGCTNVLKTGSHLKFPGVIMVTWSKFQTDDPQTIVATVRNSVATANWCPLFKHAWTKPNYSRSVICKSLFTKLSFRTTNSSSGKREILEAPKYNLQLYFLKMGWRGSAVGWGTAPKPEGCGFDSQWCHWNFSLT
jgi:hypothetical protein